MAQTICHRRMHQADQRQLCGGFKKIHGGGFLKRFQQPPINATPEQANMMGWELLRKISQASIDGWGGRLIWEIDEPDDQTMQTNNQTANQSAN